MTSCSLLCSNDQREIKSHEYMRFAAVYEISLVLPCTFVPSAHKACVWSQRVSHPAVKKPLKCSLVALHGAAIHGHILMSAAATWLCLQGAPKACSVTGNKWYGARNGGNKGMDVGKERKKVNDRQEGKSQRLAWVGIIYMYHFTVRWRQSWLAFWLDQKKNITE